MFLRKLFCEIVGVWESSRVDFSIILDRYMDIEKNRFKMIGRKVFFFGYGRN